MALSLYSLQFGSFVFGAGTPYIVNDLDGLEGLPDLRVQDDNRGYNDGMFSGRDFYNGRTITMTMTILAGNGNSAQQNLALLQAGLNPQQQGTTTLSFQFSATDNTKQINARVRARKVVVDPEFTFGFIKAQLTLFCPDPKYYDDTAVTLTLTPQAALGRTYNRTYNLSYGGGSLTGSGTVQNNGWATTGPLVTIVGPAITPTITNLTTNQSIALNITLVATDTLVIDLEQKLVTLNGSSARNLVSGNSQWFGGPPGTSQFYFSCTGYTAATKATIVYRSAYV